MASSTTTDKLKVIRKIIDDYKQDYIQMFDILDYDHESYDHLGAQTRSKRIEDGFYRTYPFDNTLTNMINENEEQSSTFMATSSTTANVVVEEQVLSQRLSQLSTTTTPPTVGHGEKRRRRQPLLTRRSSSSDSSGSPKQPTKKIRLTTNIIEQQERQLPHYLSSTSAIFDRIVRTIVDHPTTKDFDDLRQIALFIHRKTGAGLLHNLWSTYLRSGTGTLSQENNQTSSSIDIGCRYWPNHVRSQMNLVSDNQEDEHLACKNLVEDRLHQYHEEIQTYEKQLNEKIAQCSTIWSNESWEKAIKLLVEEYGLLPLQIKCKHQTMNVRHHYEEELLKLQFQRQGPTDYQIQTAWRLYKLEHKLETAKYELIEYQQRVIYNRPPASYDFLEITLPTSIQTLSDPSIRSEVFQRYQQLIQQTKTDLISIHILSKQIEIYQTQTNFDQEVRRMYENHNKQVLNKDMPLPLQSIIDQRSSNMKEQLKRAHQYNMDFYIRQSYDQMEDVVKNGTKQQEQRIGFLSSLFIDTKSGGGGLSMENYLTRKQIELLNRGPTYVAPGQIHISSSTAHHALEKQYGLLKHQLALLFSKYRIDISRSTNFERDIHQSFTQLFGLVLPDELSRRTLYEQQTIQSIQSALQKNNLLLRRTANQNNQFYLGKINELTRLEQHYMEKNADHYGLLFEITPTNQLQIQEEMKRKYLLFNSEIEKLFQAKRFHKVIYDKLCIQSEKIKLPYLHFLPDISHTTSIDVQPMIVAHQSVTSKLAHYLKQVIRPLLIRYLNRTMLLNEADFLSKFHYYTYQEKKLRSNTLFATIKINNYSTMASHNSLVTHLVNFLTDHLATNKIHTESLTYLKQSHTISIDTIKQLTELYLQNNFFIYQNKIYQLLRGAPNSLLLTEVLLNIYACAYDEFIAADPNLKSEFYGRYKDQIFFTWNGTENQLITFLQKIKNKNPHIELETSFGARVLYCNIQMENRHGQLYTSLYHHHHSNQSKYTLPYVIGHTKINHQHWFRSALIRAVHVCSNFIDFQMEQINLQMTCLLQGYSNEFIQTQLKHFYDFFHAEKNRFCLDSENYERMRRRSFDLIARQRTCLLKQQQLEDEDFIFHFSYPYDYGAYNDFNQTFVDVWKKYLQIDAHLGHENTAIRINAKPIHSLNTLLANQKPTTNSI